MIEAGEAVEVDNYLIWTAKVKEAKIGVISKRIKPDEDYLHCWSNLDLYTRMCNHVIYLPLSSCTYTRSEPGMYLSRHKNSVNKAVELTTLSCMSESDRSHHLAPHR